MQESKTRLAVALDVLACSDDGKFVLNVIVDGAVVVSDHQLVKVQFLLGVSRRVPVTYNFAHSSRWITTRSNKVYWHWHFSAPRLTQSTHSLTN